MTRGNHISIELRELLYHHLVTNDETAQYVFADILGCNDAALTLRSIRNLKSKLKRMSPAQTQDYLQGPATRRNAGRKKIYDEAVRNEIVQLRLNSNLVKNSTIAAQYKQYYLDPYPENDSAVPSKSTISRILAKSDIVRKVVERRHRHADPAKQRDFLQEVQALDADNFIDIDETLCNDTQFQQKYGWARRGNECFGIQISIGGHNFSVIAAYTTLGFICWAIYQDTVSAAEFMHFLHQNMIGMVGDGMMVILDNASIHKTDEVQVVLEEVLDGRYLFVPPYSPHLKPIELGFSNIKSYLREREAEAVLDPIGAINAAFTYYSMDGDGAAAARGNWKVYRESHRQYEQELGEMG